MEDINLKKQKKNASQEGHKSKIFLFLMFGMILFMSNFISAWEWDNIKSYDAQTKTATITNAFDFPLISSTIAEVQLKSELHEQVGLGYQKVFEYEVNSYKNYSNFIQELEVYNLKSDLKESKHIDLKYLTYEDYESPIIDCKEVESENKTLIQKCTEIGKETLQREVWKDISSNDLKIETKRISGWTDVKQGDYYEWIPSFAGVKVEEWATWEGNLFVGLVNYFKFEETTGTFNNSRNGFYNLINGGGTAGVTGKFGNGVDMEVSDGDTITGDMNNMDGLTDFSFTWWYKAESVDPPDAVFWMRSSTFYEQHSNKQDFIALGSDGNHHSNIYSGQIGVWEFRVVTANATDFCIYNNGSKSCSGFGITNGIPVANDFICSYSDTSDWCDGVLDEMGFWNRSLSATEVELLYNDGNGCAYGDETCFLGSPPTVTLTSPIAFDNSTSQSIVFNCSATDDGFEGGFLQNITLYLNNSINGTNTSVYNDTSTTFVRSLADGYYSWNCGACDNASLCANGTAQYFWIDTLPTIYIHNPTENNTNWTTREIEIDASSSLDVDEWLINVNGTNYTYVINTTFTFNEDGTYQILLYGRNAESGVYGLNDTYYLNIDTTYPIVNPIQNVSNIFTLSLPVNSIWNYTATDTHISTCYYNSTEHALTIIACNSSTTTAWATEGLKTIRYCANDTFGFQTCNTTTFTVYSGLVNYNTTPSTIAEGFNVVFNLTINLTSTPVISANLTVNGTTYSPDTIVAGTDGYYFEKTLTIPDGWGNTTGVINKYYWNYTIAGIVTNTNTTIDNLTVYELAIDDCSSYGDVILNLTLKDEESSTEVNESAGSNLEIDLVLKSKTNSSLYLYYNNTWVNESNVAVCIPANVLNNSQYQIDFTLGFDSVDHVWEFFYLDNGTLNSTKVFDGQTTYQINLMDLLTADSTSFLFNYYDENSLPVSNAIVHVFRKYIGEGIFREVERSKVDQSGDTIIHLVEEDVIYYFLITQYGIPLFTSSTYTALCQTTPCVLTITASGGAINFGTDWDLIDGGGYTLSSDTDTRIINLTYAFDEIGTMNLTIYKYEDDGSYSPINSSASTGTSGTLLAYAPLSAGNVTFFASVRKDGTFIRSVWIDFEGKASDRLGVTLAVLLGALITLTLGLMAVSEGAGVLVMIILGVALSGFLGLFVTDIGGISVVIYLILAGGILLYKLTGSRR